MRLSTQSRAQRGRGTGRRMLPYFNTVERESATEYQENDRTVKWDYQHNRGPNAVGAWPKVATDFFYTMDR